MAKNHDVTFFSFYARHEKDAHAELKNLFERVVTIPLDIPRVASINGLLDYAANAFSATPYNLARYCRPVVRQELLALLRQERYDVIVCDFLVAAGVIPWDENCPKVLFTHNVEAIIWRRHFEVARNPFWKALSWREWRRMEAVEHQYLQKADRVLVVSENDREAFAAFLDPLKLTVIATGADTEFFRPIDQNEINNLITFVGSMDWLPNEDAMFYFVDEILPLIRREAPEVTLSIIGRSPSRKLKALATRHPEIKLTGQVEDVRPFLAQGAVNIVPIRVGGGTRLKIFEAMSMGKAIVSTTVGAEGLPVNHGEHLLVADNAANFAESTVRLLRNPVERAKLGNAARSLVESKYSWAAVAEDFVTVLKDVIKRDGEGAKDVSSAPYVG